MNRHEILEILSIHKPALSKLFGVDSIALFGSVVRGESLPTSDIDLLVEFRKGNKDFFNFIRCKFYLENIFKHKVDLVMKSAVKSRIKKQIFQQAEYV
jgi:predicted nucleotidyltransferase